MKKLLYITFLFAACSAQQGNKNIVVTPAKNDTTFLLRDKNKDYYHAVYIEKNRKAVNYKEIMDFNFDHYDSITYAENSKYVKAHINAPLKRYNITDLPTRWIPLYRYKNKYYVYMPSESGALGRRIITDTAMIFWWMDGPEVKPLRTVERLNGNKFHIKAQTCYEVARDADITLYIIDPKNKIAVWEDKNQPKNNRYMLYIPVESAVNFDMVVNYCETDKMPEFEFDSIDYKALIKDL